MRVVVCETLEERNRLRRIFRFELHADDLKRWLTQQCNHRARSDNNKERANRNKDVLTEDSMISQFVRIENERMKAHVVDSE